MAKSKAQFLEALKVAVRNEKRIQVDSHTVLDYFKLWHSQGWADEWDANSCAWLFGRFTRKHDAQRAESAELIKRLFSELELEPENPHDRDLLIEAFAKIIFPKSAGAKLLWNDQAYYHLSKDIFLIKEKYPEAEIFNQDGEPIFEAIAERLYEKFPKKYAGKRLSSTKTSAIDDLRKRVAIAMTDYENNPFNRAVPTEYLVRSDAKSGPGSAVGLEALGAFRQGSPEATRAKQQEQQLIERTHRILDFLDVFITPSMRHGIWSAARKIARHAIQSESQRNSDAVNNPDL